MRGATADGRPAARSCRISIHAPHARSDGLPDGYGQAGALISIHAPHARSDRRCIPFLNGMTDFNPRSSCEERRKRMSRPRASSHFNPRSSCEERLVRLNKFAQLDEFQSTLLMRGATRPSPSSCRIPIHFNPRSSCEERPVALPRAVWKLRISIHAPHARSDGCAVAGTDAVLAISIHAPHARSDSCAERPRRR